MANITQLDLRPTYCRVAFVPETLLAHAREHLEPHIDECDTLVGKGVSGVVAATLLAATYHKHLLVVRGVNDTDHCGGRHEQRCVGVLGERWVFVDDLLSSGDTLTSVQDAVDQACRGGDMHFTTYVGIYLYTSRNAYRLPYETLRIKDIIPGRGGVDGA